MAKKVEALIKLQVPAGEANPSPPVGPALGQHGVNIMEFCKAFNAATQETDAIQIDQIAAVDPQKIVWAEQLLDFFESPLIDS